MLENLQHEMEEIQHAFKNKNAGDLRRIANQTIWKTSIHNDSVEAEIAVIAYALHKLLTKEHIQNNAKWKTIQGIINEKLAESVQSLKHKNIAQFRHQLEQLSKRIQTADKNFGNFVQNLIEKSRVKQASSLYAFGLSLGQATALTNADKKTLFNYIGYTKMHDEQPSHKTISDRIQYLEAIME